MSAFWIATIGTSVIAFALKYSGHSVPERWLSHPKVQRINLLIPIALLSALVAVQTFSEKSQLIAATWHFQGQVQGRKLKDIASWATYIHSIDSGEHITKLSRICSEKDRKISIFLQFSLDGAPDRGGVGADQLGQLADQVAGDPNLQLAGLMCVPPVEYGFDRAFGEIAKVHSAFQMGYPDAVGLSAGMSSDFEVAIAYGATHLRVGSEILGSRTYHP